MADVNGVFTLYNRKGEICTLDEWAQFFTDSQVAVAKVGMYSVSTIFLGMDLNFKGEGPPLIFETMIFGTGPLDEFCYRYATEEEARKGHATIVQAIAERDSQCE